MKRIFTLLTVAALMALMMMVSAMPAFAVANPQASCVGQDASTFAHNIEEITGGQFSNLGEFISTTGAGPEFGPFVSGRAQEDPC